MSFVGKHHRPVMGLANIDYNSEALGRYKARPTNPGLAESKARFWIPAKGTQMSTITTGIINGSSWLKFGSLLLVA